MLKKSLKIRAEGRVEADRAFDWLAFKKDYIFNGMATIIYSRQISAHL